MSDLLKVFNQSKKNYYLFLSLFTILFLFLILVLTISSCINNYIEDNITNIYINRDIYIEGDSETESYLSTLSNVETFYIDYGYLDVKSEFGSFILTGKPSSYFENINNSNGNYIAIPSNIDLDIDDELILYVDELEITFIVKEKYEVDNNTYSSIIYTDINYFNNIIEENNLLDDCFNYHLVVNSYKVVDEIIEKLEDEGYISYLYDSSGINEFKIYMSLNKFISYFIIVLIIFIVISYLVSINMIINKEKETIALLKTSGYLTKHIFIVLFISTLSLVLLSFLIALIICLVITLVLFFYKVSIFTSYQFSFLLMFKVLFSLILFLVLSLALFFQKIKRISIVDLIGE